MKKIISIILVLLLFCLTFVSSASFGEKIKSQSYEISKSKIERTINPGIFFEDLIEVKNLGSSELSVSVSISGTISDIMELNKNSLTLAGKEYENINFVVRGIEGEYEGIIRFSGDITEDVPIKIIVEETNSNIPFLFEVKPVKKTFDILKNMSFQVHFKKINSGNINNLSFRYKLNFQNETYVLDEEKFNFSNSVTFIREFDVPEEVVVGEYTLITEANYSGEIVEDKTLFRLKKRFLDLLILGFLPMWVFLIVLGTLMLSFLVYYIIKKRIESKKKYRMTLDLKTIPKKEKGFLYLGKIAETNHDTYYDPNKLTTHSIVAGATGGGKSITSQVFIEECLMKDIAVVVFDPTAQWSGMLRKCTDKKMISFYSKFGLKAKDARAFKGNVRMIKNARQKIDLEKYINPGQIQIFSLNKLDPKDMDIFVASIIRQIFKSDPKEHAGLKVLLVFDEVHRLLPKFGGSGEGFLQIERGCREFRKWGLGIMLVSQVLNDFMGAIKANISTEVQMRTRDEGDLNRIKTKYGEEFLQSLVKASVGVGMFANPAYNHAQPYFIQFRPILHNTKRLTDEELEEYNTYNDQVDEIEYQIEKLEEDKVDTFDLKMELKLIKDKIMSGSFSVVQIYLEGLGPRVKKEFEKLGKEVPKMEIELISEEEIQAGIEEARKKHEKEQAKEDSQKKEETKEEVKVEEKIVPSITFDNGAMISSLKEMVDYLPSMDDADFKNAVNEEKNLIKDWISEQFGKEAVSKIEGKISKDEMVEGLKSIYSGSSDNSKEDSNDGKEEEKD